MDKVKMRYTGPGKEADPRQVEVSEAEAAALKDTGLWAKAPSPKKSSEGDKKKEDS